MQAFRVSDVIYRVYALAVFLMFLNSMYPWFSWNTEIRNVIRIASAIVGILSIVFCRSCCIKSRENILFVAIMLFVMSWEVFTNTESLADNMLVLCEIATLIFLKDNIKVYLLNLYTKLFAILIIVSLFFYILFLIGFPLDSVYIEFSDGQYKAFNYCFLYCQLL